MIVSSSLGAVPFLGNTDATRLQMCGKQLNQAVTHLNCKRPYVIGSDYKYLSDMSKLYKLIAPCDGNIVYSDFGIMIIFFDDSYLKVYEIPEFKHCANGFATKLKNKRDKGKFKKDEIIFEYDSFTDNIPTYGYNLNTAYMPWFGFNFEDAIVISESIAKLMKCNKIETVLLPIYTHSLFRNLYSDSRFEFIPEIGKTIQDNVILYQAIPKNEENKNQILKSISIYDFTSITEDNFLFNSIPLISKLPGGRITKIKVHHMNNRLKMIDKNTESKIQIMLRDYRIQNLKLYKDIEKLFGDKYAKQILSNYFIMLDSKQEKIANIDELVYIIELEITKEYDTKIGDKISNR